MTSLNFDSVSLPVFCEPIKKLSIAGKRVKIQRDLKMIFAILNQSVSYTQPPVLKKQLTLYFNWLEASCQDKLTLEKRSGWLDVYTRVIRNKMIVFYLSRFKFGLSSEILHPDILILVENIVQWLQIKFVQDDNILDLIDKILDYGPSVVLDIHDPVCDSVLDALKEVQLTIESRLTPTSINDQDVIYEKLYVFTDRLIEVKNLQTLDKLL